MAPPKKNCHRQGGPCQCAALWHWGELRYREPAGRVREIREDEEVHYWQALRPDYHPIMGMYLISGRRKSDWVELKKKDVNLAAGVVRVPARKRKEEGDLYVNLTPRELEIIWQEIKKSPPHCEYVFTFEVQHTRWRNG